VYVHESLILVLAASFMGAAIGVVTATIFTMQQSLFTQVRRISCLPHPGPLHQHALLVFHAQMPSQFGLPWLIIILVAIVSALLSAVAPARRLTSTSITKLLRNVY
jgi:ABC-type antimicrobial peptide transport system permease subunit